MSFQNRFTEMGCETRVRVNPRKKRRGMRRYLSALSTVVRSLLIVISSAMFSAFGAAQECLEPHEDPSSLIQGSVEGSRRFNVSGVVTDDANQVMADVRLSLYRVSRTSTPVLLAETRSDSEGLFQFMNVPPAALTAPEETLHDIVVATTEMRASVVKRIVPNSADKLVLVMPPAGKLTGKVADPEGNLLSGAVIWCQDITNVPLAGVMSTVSDADGKFKIVDLPFCRKDQQPIDPLQIVETETDRVYRIVVHHSDFADQTFGIVQFPANMTVTLASGGQVRGRVTDTVTGKPAANVVVTLQPTKQTSFGLSDRNWLRFSKTNSDGVYEFQNLAAAEYNIWARSAERTCVALNSIPVLANQMNQVPDLELIEGGWVEGHVLTLLGQPVSRDPVTGSRLYVGLNGPSRPRSGTSFESCAVGDEGRFRFLVPAGRNFPYLTSTGAWSQIWRKEKFEQGVHVSAGESLKVTFRVGNKPAVSTPARRTVRDPVPLPLPVADERDAAETIRDLGGWYQVDEQQHVVEVNMCYDDRTGVRYDNDHDETDESLRIAPAFPKLKRLFLHKRQATDESMACLADLEGLEKLFVWDAIRLTDACAPHLGHLKNLTEIHVSQSQIGDDALKVLSSLPKLEQMSLQGNAFTDAGVAHLAHATGLRSVWIGLSKGAITDAGLEHLAGLEQLEELELQQTEVTAEGVAELLRKRPNLRIIK